MEIYADGSGYSNGACAICVKFNSKKEGINHKTDFLEVFYNEIDSETLEYMALIKAIELARNCGDNIYSDSRTVVDEVNLLKNPKERNKELHKKARELISKRKEVKIFWIPRDKNLAGIYLEKRLSTIRKNVKSILNPYDRLINRRKEWKNKIYGRKRK